MSEYQYYEFTAVDRALDDRQLDQLRALSTRAHITPTSFVNTYEWGSFRGDPRVLVERYFDAHVYLANWGTRELMLRVPARLVRRTRHGAALLPRRCGVGVDPWRARDRQGVLRGRGCRLRMGRGGCAGLDPARPVRDRIRGPAGAVSVVAEVCPGFKPSLCDTLLCIADDQTRHRPTEWLWAIPFAAVPLAAELDQLRHHPGGHVELDGPQPVREEFVRGGQRWRIAILAAHGNREPGLAQAAIAGRHLSRCTAGPPALSSALTRKYPEHE